MEKLLFSEDFDLTCLDENKWNIRIGNRWANAELQAYTKENQRIENNKLIITGKNEVVNEREFTSSRIDTFNKFSFCFGKVEVVAKLPTAVGSWPAIWLMPDDGKEVGWPKCGEIDIMEHCGHKKNKVFFSVHTKTNNHMVGNGYSKTQYIPNVTDGFHKYSFLWQSDKLVWLVDDIVTYQLAKSDLKINEEWPFNKPYYLIINMAIGGNFCEGQVNPEDFPTNFEIKSVKIYGE